jgi:hypothetical protein
LREGFVALKTFWFSPQSRVRSCEADPEGLYCYIFQASFAYLDEAHSMSSSVIILALADQRDEGILKPAWKDEKSKITAP